MSSELGAGGVSCLDVSDLSSGHPSPTVDDKNAAGRASLTEMCGEPDNAASSANDNVLHDYR